MSVETQIDPLSQPIVDPLADFEEPVAKVETKVEPQAATLPPELNTKLDQIRQTVNGNELLTKVLAIPGVQDLLRAQQSGVAARVLLGNDAQPSQPAPAVEAEPDWEKLKDDPKAYAQTIVSLVGKELAPAVETKLKSTLDPIGAQLKAITDHLSAQEGEKSKSAVQKVREKYKDFDTLAPKIAELNQQFQGLVNPERLYILAKLETGAPLIPQTQLETEKPTDEAAKRPALGSSDKKYPLGRGGMKQRYRDVLSSLDLEDLNNL